VIRFEKDVLILEFQTKDGLFGLLKSALQEIRLGLHDLAGLDFDRGRINSHLRLRVHRMSSLTGLPGCKPDEAKLKIGRKHREAAGQLVSQVQLRLSEALLEAADRKLRELRSDP